MKKDIKNFIYLFQFTESVAVRKNSILFRLVTSRDKSEEEDKILRKYFPNTAILGMETYGQCGWNKFPRSIHYYFVIFSINFHNLHFFRQEFY